jgi:hypothetical protein
MKYHSTLFLQDMPQSTSMKKHLFTIALTVSILISCEHKKSITENKKTYRYVAIVDEESLSGRIDRKEKEAVTIEAVSDSAAFLEAFQMFCISVKSSKDMKSATGKVFSTPKDFKLYDDKNNEISNTSFLNKDLRKKEIEATVFSLNNNIQESLDRANREAQKDFSKTTRIDSAKIKQLERLFRIKKDDFSNNNKQWYEPKSAPNYTNANGIYCYFQTENGIPGKLRFRLQYHSDEWLFFTRVQFSIDGKAFEYKPQNTETDNGNGGYIWEWFDEAISESDKPLITALANAKSAKMKLIGKKYYDIKNISQTQIKGINQTLELYRAMGGQF